MFWPVAICSGEETVGVCLLSSIALSFQSYAQVNCHAVLQDIKTLCTHADIDAGIFMGVNPNAVYVHAQVRVHARVHVSEQPNLQCVHERA